MAFSKEEHPHRRKIRRSSFELLYEDGYQKTSYSAIARRSGFGRSLIQHYYPVKQQIIEDLVEEVSDMIGEAVAADPSDDASTLISSLMACYCDLLHSAQLYFGLLTYDDAMRNLTREILATRFLSTAAIEQNIRFMSTFLENESPELFRAASIRAVDGTYGLLYDIMARGEDVDVDRLALSCTASTFMYLSDTMTYRSINEYLRRFLWSDEYVRDVLQGIVAELFIA